MSDEQYSIRVGIGYDAHRLVQSRDLILGGIKIPFDKGLLGHSDADVLVHALIDAILGGLGEGDIGRHFPDTDRRYKNISSLKLLSEIMKLLDSRKGKIEWVDAVIIAQRPRLSSYIDSIRVSLSATMGISSGLINVKAKTTEGMGFSGREEGIAAQVVATLKVAR